MSILGASMDTVIDGGIFYVDNDIRYHISVKISIIGTQSFYQYIINKNNYQGVKNIYQK